MTEYYIEEPSSYSALSYYIWVTSADITELEYELARLEKDAEESPSLVGSVQLSMLNTMSVLATESSRDDALLTLQEIQNPMSDTVSERGQDYVSFSGILLELFEQRHIAESLQESVELLQARQAYLEAELSAANAINDDLQEQIEALTSIEQQLIEREQLQDNNE